MAAAKAYKKKPIDIANGVVEHLKDSKIFEEVSAVMPGFINLKIGSSFLADYMNGMRTGEKLGMEPAEHCLLYTSHMSPMVWNSRPAKL